MKTYEYYVQEGKKLVGQIKNHECQIAYFATQVCEIKYGGRSERYTIEMYAKSIGLPKGKVHRWTSIYRNVIAKIDISKDSITRETWAKAGAVHVDLKKEMVPNKGKIHNQSFKGQVPAATVKRLFETRSVQRSYLYVTTEFLKRANLKLRTEKSMSRSELLQAIETCQEMESILKNKLASSVRLKKKTTSVRV